MKQVIPAGFFADVVNPTDEEIVRWAYIEGAHYPPEMEQDWNLCVAEPGRKELLVRLASDAACPTRKFFLSCLYLMIGDCIRSSGRTWSREEASAWVVSARPQPPADVGMFFSRAKDLTAGRATLDYEKWCAGGYAYRDKEV